MPNPRDTGIVPEIEGKFDDRASLMTDSLGSAATGDETLPQGAEPRTYPSRPFVGVGVVVFRGDDVLLVRRGKPPKKDQWSLPGGAQHLGETVEDAARREVGEETGLDVDLLGLLDVVDFVDRDEAGDVRHHYTLVDWMAESRDGTPRAGDDVTDVTWVPLNRLEDHDLWSETSKIIHMAAARRSKDQRSTLDKLLEKAGIHGHVWLRALIFGLGAYAAINLLILLINKLKSLT